MGNPFVHLELNTTDTAAAKEFYSGLFGWTFTDNDMGNGIVYSVFKPAEGPGGGIFSIPDMPTRWLAYVGVEDIKQSTEKAVSLGATLHIGPQEVPDMGWFSILGDPAGAAFALWQSTNMPAKE
ncbi:VOC family protein [Granulicella sp. WH15]|uniref:VOC family protein n=1 Tax=Granulicella sp. WH15 TaxID=2602070 RepID=UPI001366D278|nr:VOC family protein [Granulicella sp. WH15]QHN02011.1 VOC family protein [Granulicella sp. WH15]